MSGHYDNLALLPNDSARTALESLVAACRDFALALPRDEPAQAAGLCDLIARAGSDIRSGVLDFETVDADGRSEIRLYKAPLASGRLKLQLFPLDRGNAHPPHAHHDLLSCQIVVRGHARVTEYSLIRYLNEELLEIRAETVKSLGPGEGVFTLAKRNNIHWQEGLADGTVLLNINWQGLLEGASGPGARPSGRRGLVWSELRPTDGEGCFVVPVLPPERDAA